MLMSPAEPLALQSGEAHVCDDVMYCQGADLHVGHLQPLAFVSCLS